MLSTLNEHKSKAETIRSYITTLKDIASIPAKYPKENTSKALLQFVSMPPKRSYDYSLIIITLYGILESFIEDISGAYLNALSNKIKQYSKLPEALIKNHIDLSAKLINNTSIKYETITKETIISNLHSCLNQLENPYKLNNEAFTQHTSNFRIDTIQEFFKLLGIENVRNSIKKSQPLINFLVEKEGCNEKTIKDLPDTKYFEILEDLVQRRNYIAHGSKIDDLLSYDILDEYSGYIISFIESIFISVSDKYFETLVDGDIAQKLGKPIKVINNKIICINSSNFSIKIGQTIIGKNGRDTYYRGAIESIHLDGKEISEIGSEKAVDVGLGVSFKAKNNYTYYLID